MPIIGVTSVKQVEDAYKAQQLVLEEKEIQELETLADRLDLNVIRFWEKEMK